MRQVPYYLEIGRGPKFNGRMCADARQHIIRADILHFADYERVGRTVLVAENLTDAKLYQILGKALVTAKGWQWGVELELRGGGGHTIGGVFAEVVRDGRLALGLADSDREFPPLAHQHHDRRAGLGDTAKALLDAAPEHCIQHAHVIHARDLENLLPFTVYEEALAPHRNSPSMPEQLQALDRAVPQHRLPWRAYADLKAGLRLVDVQGLPDGDYERFWAEVARAAGRDRCRDPAGCRAAGKCDCYVVEGLGPKALERALAWLRGESLERLARMLDLEGDPQMEALCVKIAAWGSALTQRIRA